jgi:zinc and cadmium transporter
MTVATLFHAGGGSRGKVLLVTFLFAGLVPIGVVLFMLGAAAAGGTATAVPYALAFSAGTFLCIAAADLLPEVQFHRHDRVGLSIALVLGLVLALAVGRMEALAHAGHEGHEGQHMDHADHAGHAGHADHADHATHDH